MSRRSEQKKIECCVFPWLCRANGACQGFQKLLSRLRFRETPIDGESLLGFLWRVAARNCATLGTLHGTAGITYRTNSPTHHALERLADLTGVAVNVLDEMSCRTNAPSRTRRFGKHILPRRLVSWQRRRFCPGCIAESPHHRAIWDISLVSACPLHACRLVFQCDACGKSLEWLGDNLWTCRCGRDFTRIPAKSIAHADLVGTQVVYGMLDQPSFKAEVQELRVILPFADLDVGQGLDLLHSLAMTRPALAHWSVPGDEADENVHLALNEALEACRRWPTGMEAFLASAAQRFNDPVRIWVRALPSGVGEQVKSDLLECLATPENEQPKEAQTVSIKEAAPILGIPVARLQRAHNVCTFLSGKRMRGMTRAPLLRSLVFKLLSSTERLLTKLEASEILGVPPMTFEAIVQAGLVLDVTGKAPSSGTLYDSAEVHRFLDEVLERLIVNPALDRGQEVRLGSSTTQPALHGRRCIPVLRGILDGRLRCARVDEQAIGLHRIVLNAIETSRFIASES
ncbi:TniQ family protein [Azospirillum oryzae]|nr:TniQ family protein [Azospirillum oryzae]